MSVTFTGDAMRFPASVVMVPMTPIVFVEEIV